MDRNKLSAILLMLMAVSGALVLLFILGGGLLRTLFGGASTSGIVSVAGGWSVSLGLLLGLAAIVIAVVVVIYRKVIR